MPLTDGTQGWLRVESRSRPGEFVYENQVTKERQAWFPTEPAVKGGAVDPKRVGLAYVCDAQGLAQVIVSNIVREGAYSEYTKLVIVNGWDGYSFTLSNPN